MLLVDRVQHLFEILDEFSKKSGAQISLVKENVSLQPNRLVLTVIFIFILI